MRGITEKRLVKSTNRCCLRDYDVQIVGDVGHLLRVRSMWAQNAHSSALSKRNRCPTFTADLIASHSLPAAHMPSFC